MKCPHCQTTNPEGVKFCGECGQSLSVELICPKCSYKNPQDVKFCHECGNSIDEQEPVIQPSSFQPTSFAGERYQGLHGNAVPAGAGANAPPARRAFTGALP